MAPVQTATDVRAWSALTPPLAQWILDATASMGFARMTPVQASTIPLFMGNKDVVVEAVTGSGKTLAFLLPVIEKLLRRDEPVKRHHIGAIIISPTRELASQIHTVLVSFLGFHEASSEALQSMQGGEKLAPSTVPRIVPQLLLGGTTTPAQDLSTFLRVSPNLLIATPGRLLELLTSSHVHCPQSSFEVLVLDEADRLLDLGFKEDIQRILARLPKQRRTGLFSASVGEAVSEIVRVGLRNPVKIAVRVKSARGEDRRTPTSLQMSYLLAKPSQKLPCLFSLLMKLQPVPSRTIIYLSTCAAVDYFQHILTALLPTPFQLVPLHGKHPAKVREKNFAKYLSSTSPMILLTTDVAARGLDIPQVDLVVQIDPPSDPKVFIHRCGRAGRAGRRGLSVVFLHPGREEDYIPFLAVRESPITPLLEPAITISDTNASTTTNNIRQHVLQDRMFHDKAQRAFVSWVKSYSKHQASSIFRMSELDWTDLGNAWGLLRMPKMPELKGWQGDRTLGVDINMDEYAYKDKLKESARRKALEEWHERKLTNKDESAAGGARAQKRKGAWSAKGDARDEKEVRRTKKQKKREAERQGKMTVEERDEDRTKATELEDLLEKVKAKYRAEEEFQGFDDGAL